MSRARLIGGILLIAGTCIGGGMLGLPIATASGGFLASSVLFVVIWMLMCFTALLTLEVNLCFPRYSNVISMARATLGRPAEFLCWTIYLFFLYALVSAFVAGGQDIMRGLLQSVGIVWPVWLVSLIFIVVFGAVVMLGTRQVDLFNRFVMAVKFSSLFLLFMLVGAHVDLANLYSGHAVYLLPALSVVVTSFGFSIIVPSLRTYFHDDVRQLRIAIIMGSFIPLLCYLVWEGVIFGVIPLYGEAGLSKLMLADQPMTSLMQSISYYVPAATVTILTKIFTSFCALTAFVCVSLSLSDYLADGLGVVKEGAAKWLVLLATFVPPFVIAVFYPRAFIVFLSFAGLCCVLLQALMPAIMSWRVRYHLQKQMVYQTAGGKLALLLAMLGSSAVVIISGYYLAMGSP